MICIVVENQHILKQFPQIKKKKSSYSLLLISQLTLSLPTLYLRHHVTLSRKTCACKASFVTIFTKRVMNFQFTSFQSLLCTKTVSFSPLTLTAIQNACRYVFNLLTESLQFISFTNKKQNKQLLLLWHLLTYFKKKTFKIYINKNQVSLKR